MSSVWRWVARKRGRDDDSLCVDKTVVINLDESPPPSSSPAAVAAAAAQINNRVTIDVDALDDEVQAVSPSQVPRRVRRRSATRTQTPVVIMVEDLEEVNERRHGTFQSCARTDPARGASNKPPGHRLRESPAFQVNSMPNPNVIVREVVREVPKVIVKEVIREPSFTCPVCLNKLVDAATTICGHVFCEGCIKTAIKTQKKCPTCRKSLRINNFHRVYFPNTE